MMNNSTEKETKNLPVVTTDATTTPTTKVENETVAKEEKKNMECIELKHLDMEFTQDLMSVPTVSSEEYRMVAYIIMWARHNNVDYEFDSYGNVYLTKGKVKEGEYYPCVTSHLDTVQQKQRPYAQVATTLELKIRKGVGTKHELYVDGMGIGADCKTGILISLSLVKHFDKIKACFFLEEEIGMKGSEHMNTEWFKDVSYVIGWDSPELNRAAWACSGTKLFDKAFFEEHLEEVCEKHGLTKFNSEPFTDVKLIREKTEIICMNFGNGGYNAHGSTEYMVLEDTDHALGMGIELIETIPTDKQYLLEHKTKSYSWIRQSDGTYKKPEDDETEVFFDKRNGFTRSSSTYGGYNSGNGSHQGYYNDEDWDDYYAARYGGSGSHSGSTSSGTSTTTRTTSSTKPNTEMVEVETVKYISERYDSHIADMKKKIEDRCKELGLEFAQFADVFETKIQF